MKTPHVMFLIAVAMAWTAPALAQVAGQDAKAAYQYAMDTAEAGYDAAKGRCDTMAGVPHEICVADARAARVRIEEEATAAHKNTLAA